MVELMRVDRGKFAGQGKLTQMEVKNLFEFCRNFDIANIQEDPEYIFDVRGGVIHWLDRNTKDICSSLYFDLTKGDVKIEVTKASVWNKSIAFERWYEIISKAQQSQN